MKLYSYPKCSTCRKAAKFLEEKNVEFELVDISQSPPTEKELELALQSVEGNLRKIFNTSGQLYRQMKISEKLDQLSKKEAFQLLRSEGMLVKRPMAIGHDKAKVGFKADEWSSF